VDSCRAASPGDCGGKLSREHTISECLFPSGKVMVRGFDWCRNEPKTIGVASLVGRILCERHNNSLSELDSEMLKCFESIRESARWNDVRRGLGLSSALRSMVGCSNGDSSKPPSISTLKVRGSLAIMLKP
jgi:hypothetical protein